MITREALLKSSEYWTEIIQNKIYNDLADYIQNNDIPNKHFVENLGISKGRVSQILNGANLNFRIDTLVKLCLAIDKIPDFHLVDVNEFISKDSLNTVSLIFNQTDTSHKRLDEMLGYKPGVKTNNYNIDLNSFVTIGESYSITETIIPGSKAA
ncbi:MAG: hypothetical protein MUC93_03925 [Bacteroidales bacterium]|jgi:predicted XRE-type DNA-binding protein|nr:hypothetical protein [Bacteroidales bacterium]